jgi:hypothetical protein
MAREVTGQRKAIRAANVLALGAAEFGAVAIGALAIGRLAVGRLAIKKARFGALVSRFRSSQAFAAPSDANFGIKGTLATL